MPVGLTKDAGWEIGVSRTLPVPLEAACEFLTSPGGAALWLGAAAAPPLHTCLAPRGARRSRSGWRGRRACERTEGPKWPQMQSSFSKRSAAWN
jgi:hypothetical protein